MKLMTCYFDFFVLVTAWDFFGGVGGRKKNRKKFCNESIFHQVSLILYVTHLPGEREEENAFLFLFTVHRPHILNTVSNAYWILFWIVFCLHS